MKKQRLETCSNNEQVDENEETDSMPTVDERKRIREVKVQSKPLLLRCWVLVVIASESVGYAVHICQG